MRCFKCINSFENLKLYIIHLKCVHLLNVNDDYECTIDSCKLKFSSRSLFLRHVKRVHKIFDDVVCSQVTGCATDESISSNVVENASRAIHNIETQRIEKLFNISSDANLETHFYNFLSNLHRNSSLTKKTIDEIYKLLRSELLYPILKSTSATTDEIETVMRAHGSLKTFHRFENFMKSNNLLSTPNQVEISNKIGAAYKKGKLTHVAIRERVSLMPIKNQIIKLLQIPNLLNEILNNLNSLSVSNEDSIKHFVQGAKWMKIKEQYKDEIVIPLFLYSDDFEPDNALGSNAGNHKQTCFYYTIPILPQHLLTSPNYVFEALIFQSQLKKENYGNCVKPLINVLKELEENGIELEIDGEKKKVFIACSLLIGDNLAVHEMLGLTLGFNSTYFCRFCMCTRNESKIKTKPDPSKTRTKEQYDTRFVEMSDNNFGIREKCYFHELKFIHAVENAAVDIMHDVFEGFGPSDVAKLLSELISQKKFNLAILNQRIHNFDYGEIEIGNLSKEILASHLQTSIKMSASEFKCFLHFLPMMIGDLVPRNNRIWKILLEFCEIVDILMKSNFDEQLLEKLESKTERYLIDVSKFLKIALKPKHHFMLHYGQCIKEVGPLRHIMCFPFEQKNRDVKKYAKVSHQRVNLSRSLSYKCIMRTNKFFKDHALGLPETISCTNATKISVHQKSYWNDVKNDLIYSQDDIHSVVSLTYKNKIFKQKLFLFSENAVIELFQIIEILKVKNEFYLILKQQKISDFDRHYQCYFIIQPYEKFKIKKINDFIYPPVTQHELLSGKKAIKIKYV